MGLAVFDELDFIFSERKKVVDFYMNNLDFTQISTMKIRENTTWNYSYFPVIFNSEEDLIRVQKQLNAADVFPRRYFYPSLNTIDFVKGEEMPISESIASKILCLPLYVGLEKQDLEKISTIINTTVACE